MTELRRGLSEILAEAMRVDGAAFGKIRVAKPDSGALEVEVHSGFSDGFIETFRAIPPEAEAPAARAARLCQRVTVPDLSRLPADEPFIAAVREEGVRAMQATPLVAPSGRVVGTLSTHFGHAYHVTTASAIVLNYYAARAAALIERVVFA